LCYIRFPYVAMVTIENVWTSWNECYYYSMYLLYSFVLQYAGHQSSNSNIIIRMKCIMLCNIPCNIYNRTIVYYRFIYEVRDINYIFMIILYIIVSWISCNDVSVRERISYVRSWNSIRLSLKSLFLFPFYSRET
jgi:hypothetical protein